MSPGSQKPTVVQKAKVLDERRWRLLLSGMVSSASPISMSLRSEQRKFQLWALMGGENAIGVVTCDDGNDCIAYEQALNFTDFPEPGIRLYFCNGTILLPNDY
jgi:hypothetical protein